MEDHWEDVHVSRLGNGTTGYRPGAMLEGGVDRATFAQEGGAPEPKA
jgi:hypothetical protein